MAPRSSCEERFLRLLARIRSRHADVVRAVETEMDDGEFSPEYLPDVIDHYYRHFCTDHDPEAQIDRLSSSNPYAESSFGNILAHIYGSVPGGSLGGLYLWCQIGRCYESAERMSIIHLVDVDFADGQRIADTLFGDMVASHMWHPTNGLLVSTRFACLMDEDRAAIVPPTPVTHSVPTPDGTTRRTVRYEYAFLLLDPELIQTPPAWADGLHGTHLQFLNDARPAPHYVYFRLAMTLLRRLRHGGVVGMSHLDDFRHLGYSRMALWDTPVADTELKQGLLLWIAQHYGSFREDQANVFWYLPDGPPPLAEAETDALLLTCHLNDLERERARRDEHENGTGGDAMDQDDDNDIMDITEDMALHVNIAGSGVDGSEDGEANEEEE